MIATGVASAAATMINRDESNVSIPPCAFLALSIIHPRSYFIVRKRSMARGEKARPKMPLTSISAKHFLTIQRDAHRQIYAISLLS